MPTERSGWKEHRIVMSRLTHKEARCVPGLCFLEHLRIPDLTGAQSFLPNQLRKKTPTEFFPVAPQKGVAFAFNVWPQ